MNREAQQAIHANSLLTSYQVGSLLQVNPSSVNKWIKEGRIPAFRTPGGHRRIRASALVAFLDRYDMPVPSSLAIAVQRRLLVVDPEPGSKASISAQLAEHAGAVQVEWASNAAQALHIVASFEPHAVVIGMVEGDEDEAFMQCRLLRKDERMQGVSVVLVCVNPTADLELRAREAGATRLVRRPPSSQVLLDALCVC